MTPSDPLTTWRHAVETLAGLGYTLPTEPPAAGTWTRIPAAGKGERNRSAAVTITADGGAVHIVDHAAGYSETVQGRRAPVTDVAELRRLRAECDRQRRRDEAAQRERHRAGTEAARRAWASAVPCDSHPYMTTKGVTLPGCRVLGDELLVPLTDADGALQSLQRIRADGTKRCWPGAPITGAAYRIGEVAPSGRVIVCAGAATGATLADKTGDAVVSAMFAGNLLAVAETLRARHADVNIVIAGDDDRQAPRNVGRVKAMQAARAVGGRIAFPSFCDACDGSCSDFNDLAACERRRECVR